MNVLLGLLSLGALSLFFAHVLRRSSALMPLLAIATAMVFFMAAGMLGFLWAGGIIWYVLCAAALGFTIFKVKGKIISLFTPGLAFFLLGGAALVLLFQFTRPMLTLWDEFTFWGTAAKVTSGANELYTLARSSLIARSYPPALIVYSYMMQFFGGFSEAGYIAVYGILYLACFSAASAAFSKHKSAALLMLAALVVVPLFFETTRPAGHMMWSYIACMADVPMGLMFGGALCFYFAGGEKDIRLMIPFAVILWALTGVKDMALALAMVALFVVLLDMVFCERDRLKLFKLKGWLAVLAVGAMGLLAIAGSYFTWSWHLASLPGAAVNRNDLGAAGNQFTMLFSGIQMLFGLIPRSEQFSGVLGAMMNAFFTEPVSLIGSGVMVLVLIWIITALALFLSATRRQTKRIIVFTLSMLVGFIAFYVFNIFTYAFIFSALEASTLREYARYINPFWMGWLVGALMLLSRSATYHKATFYRLRMARAASGVMSVAIVAVVMLRGNWHANFVNTSPSLYTERQNVRAVAGKAAEEGMKPEDDVYIISQGDDGTRFYMFGFELSAVRTPVYAGTMRDEMDEHVLNPDGEITVYGGEAVTLAKPGEEHALPFSLDCTPEELTAFLWQYGCTHLLVDVVDGYLTEDLAFMFSDELAGWEGLSRGHTYYRIEWDEDGTCTFVPQLSPAEESGGVIEDALQEGGAT